MAALVNAYQDIFVHGRAPDWQTIWPVAVFAACLCVAAFLLFRRRAGEMVDEL
jgi:lipopolysaccharide transport system permease protein